MLTLLLFAVALVAIASIVVTARVTRSRAQAQSAADAVALAVAVSGSTTAEGVAAANQAVIVRLDVDENSVIVTVARGGVRASARAIRVECQGSCAAIP